MITNCEYIHCSLESPIYTYKNVLKMNLTHNGFILVICHSLVVVYTDSGEFPRCNRQMQFPSIPVFLQVFRLSFYFL